FLVRRSTLARSAAERTLRRAIRTATLTCLAVSPHRSPILTGALLDGAVLERARPMGGFPRQRELLSEKGEEAGGAISADEPCGLRCLFYPHRRPHRELESGPAVRG